MGTPVARLRRVVGLGTGLALAAGIIAAAPGVGAQEASTVRPLVIRSVDVTSYPSGSMVVNTPPGTELVVRQDGEPVTDVQTSSLADGQVPRATILVVDVSSVMARADALDLTKLALTQLVQGQTAGERIGLATFGVSGRPTLQPTTDKAAVLDAIDGLQAATRVEASRNEGLREATDYIEELRKADPRTLVDVVVVAGSTDSSSTIGEHEAFGALGLLQPVVHTVGVAFDGFHLDSGALARLADVAPGGDAVVVDQPANLVAAITATRATIDSQTLVRWTGPEGARAMRLEVTAGDRTGAALATAGQQAQGNDLQPAVESGVLGDGPAILRQDNAKWLVLSLAMAAFVLLAYGVFLLLVRDTTDLGQVLRHYDDTPVADDADEASGGLVQSKLLQRAVAITGKLAEQQGLLTKVERALERADLPLRPAEALLVYGATLVVGAALVLVLTGGNLLFTLLGVVLVALVPPGIVSVKAGQRKAKFQAVLPDMLQLLSGSLRAGYSLMQGVEAVSREVEEPMGKELRRVLLEARLGRPLEVALDDVATRMGSADFAWAVMAIGIQREVGGNLAELLMTVAETMTLRERMRRDVKSLTAEGRVSAVVLAILPPALAGAMYAVNPDYIRVLFTDKLGNMLLGVSIALALAGFAWMKKLAKVEV